MLPARRAHDEDVSSQVHTVELLDTTGCAPPLSSQRLRSDCLMPFSSRWPQLVPGTQRPRAPPGLPARRLRCQRTSRPASVPETPNAEARVDGRWSSDAPIEFLETVGSLRD